MNEKRETDPMDEARLSAWLDHQLDDAEREDFERRLAADPELKAEAAALERAVSALRALPGARAPDSFLASVQNRIRKRSRSSYYALLAKSRFPYEAGFNIVLIALLVALYMMAMPASAPEPRPVDGIDPAVFDTGDAEQSSGAAVLGAYGELEVVAGEPGRYALTLPAARLDALRRDLALLPSLAIDGSPEEAGDGRIRVRVRFGRSGPNR